MNVGVQGALSTDSADDLVLDFNPDQLRLSFYGGQLEAYRTGEAGGRLFVVGDYFGANGATALRSITFRHSCTTWALVHASPRSSALRTMPSAILCLRRSVASR